MRTRVAAVAITRIDTTGFCRELVSWRHAPAASCIALVAWVPPTHLPAQPAHPPSARLLCKRLVPPSLSASLNSVDPMAIQSWLQPSEPEDAPSPPRGSPQSDRPGSGQWHQSNGGALGQTIPTEATTMPARRCLCGPFRRLPASAGQPGQNTA